MFSLAPQLSTRHCSRLLLSAVLRLPIDLLPERRSAANPPHAAAAVDRRDRQIDRFINPAPHMIRALSETFRYKNYCIELS